MHALTLACTRGWPSHGGDGCSGVSAEPTGGALRDWAAGLRLSLESGAEGKDVPPARARRRLRTACDDSGVAEVAKQLQRLQLPTLEPDLRTELQCLQPCALS
eukprot:366197-Chlamydomonas_euryale.AAC.2